MRKLNYKLADGTVVKSYPEAVESGQRFKEFFIEIKEKVAEVSPIRQACIDTYGMVTQHTIALVRGLA